jgi:hypothetical protein
MAFYTLDLLISTPLNLPLYLTPSAPILIRTSLPHPTVVVGGGTPIPALYCSGKREIP